MSTLRERITSGTVKEMNYRWHYWVKAHIRTGKKVRGHWRKFPWEI